MVIFPNAKINLGLRITEKRSDGYHNIETVFYPVKLSDALEFVIPAGPGEDEITVTGLETGGKPEDNIVLKAAGLVRKSAAFPNVRIHLHKSIPAGAGLGGGSADAAFFIKSVNKFFSLGISDAELKSISLAAGSDCPFFIDNTPAFATGRGEILNPVPHVLEGLWITLLNPGLHLSTAEAYADCRPQRRAGSLDELILKPVHEWKDHIFNDFEDFAFRKQPVIARLKEGLYASGAIFSLMSGSGSTVFGLFSRKPELPDQLRRYLIYEGTA